VKIVAAPQNGITCEPAEIEFEGNGLMPAWRKMGASLM
jgi:hypothetical protein